MQCEIYKGRKKPDTYLYMESPGDFSRLPPSLPDMLGALELVMTLELGNDRKLARANAREIITALKQQGYYLQLPPDVRGVISYGTHIQQN
jgi:uncharacterized protein YcgL (UPF0745 family)